jgi:hypothetical protein
MPRARCFDETASGSAGLPLRWLPLHRYSALWMRLLCASLLRGERLACGGRGVCGLLDLLSQLLRECVEVRIIVVPVVTPQLHIRSVLLGAGPRCERAQRCRDRDAQWISLAASPQTRHSAPSTSGHACVRMHIDVLSAGNSSNSSSSSSRSRLASSVAGFAAGAAFGSFFEPSPAGAFVCFSERDIARVAEVRGCLADASADKSTINLRIDSRSSTSAGEAGAVRGKIECRRLRVRATFCVRALACSRLILSASLVACGGACRTARRDVASENV